VGTVRRILRLVALKAGWTERETTSGMMWVDPGEQFQLRISWAHGAPRLYAQKRLAPRGIVFLGRADLKP